MKFLAKYRTLISVFTAFLIVAVAIGAIFWARGFKPDFKNGKIERTGLLVISSTPTGAQVYLDDRLTSVTDTNIAFLDPKTYKLKIEKDGYITWEKDIEIIADLSTEIKAILFPQAPEIKPLTTTGASAPQLSPDSEKLVYGTGGERGGVNILPLSGSPLNFRQNPRLLVKNTANLDFTKAKFTWAPDSKQLIARFVNENNVATANLLIDVDQNNQEPKDITASLLATLSSWQEEINARAQTESTLAPDEVKNATASAQISSPVPSPKTVQKKPISSPSPIQQPDTSNQLLNYYPTGLIFSPDQEKILYKNKENKYKVYDIKLKKEFAIPDFENFINISWFPDSNHLVVAQKELVSIIEADGTNKMTIFSGKFENGFVFAHPSASRIILLTTLTQTEGTLPNLYAINLK